MEEQQLKRALSLPLLTFYGLGTILGAGIYVLIGEVAGLAGMSTPISFLIASLLVAFTAFSYAELSARYPVSAGEAAYVSAAFNRQRFSTLVGVLVVCVALVSTATIANGFVGYLQLFVEIPAWLAITLLMLTLCTIAIWGITESVLMATIATLVELAGLFMIITVAGDSLSTLPERMPEIIPDGSWLTWAGVLAGTYLAFYAFIGFEDMVNVAEEVKQPEKTMPQAIILVLILSTLLYMLVAITAVLTMPPQQLASSQAPLASLYQHATGNHPTTITLISLFAVVNGALVQIIMASRVLYGMSRMQWIPPWFSTIHSKTRTPHLATIFFSAIALILALWLPLVTLAEITSLITLAIFTFMNLALLVIKQRTPQPTGIKCYPSWIPLLGLLFSFTFMSYQLFIFAGG